MDPRRFDNLTRALAAPRTRRRFLAGVAALIGVTKTAETDAASCRISQDICREHANCCSGVCLAANRNGRRICAKSLGEPSLNPAECASGIVADGVCCNSACTGQCEACNLRGAAGTCSPVSGAPVNGHAACAGSAVCTGYCDGANRTSCAFPSTNTSCGSPVCDNTSGQATTYACNGAGTCTPNVTTCGLYVCNETTCKTSCSNDSDCIGAAYCNNGVCTSDRSLGHSCDRRDQCQSGACVNGVCCSSSSCPECQSCAAGGGSCAPDASLNSTTCSVGICQNGTCGCQTGQRFCDGACGAYECCANSDCGTAATCQTTTCNLGTHICESVNVDTDPRCVSDACATRSCVNGVCNEVAALSICGVCETVVSPCNPAVGPQCAPKVCNSPGPCQMGPGVCDPTKLGCVYTNLCADCEICQNGTCVDNCAPGVACAPVGICNSSTNICGYSKTCGPCALCQPDGTCRAYPNGTIPDNGAFTCCEGDVNGRCTQGTCPIPYTDKDGFSLQCCGTVIGNTCCNGIDVDGKCCPDGSVAACTGSGRTECCDHQCSCNGFGCFCA